MDCLVSGMDTLSVKSAKRRLTAAEIESIAMQLVPNRALPPTIAEAHIERTRSQVRRQLAAVETYPEALDELATMIVGEYNRARVQPGESVGIVTAQSIGERQTQMTLDTFHSAGAALKTVLSGVPRFSELLSASPNPKAVVARVYPSQKCGSIGELREHLGARVKSVLFGELVLSHERKTLADSDSREWYAGFDLLYGTQYQKYEYCVSFKLDVGKLYDARLELPDVAALVEKYEDVACAFSPTFLGVLDIYFDSTNISSDQLDEYVAHGLVGALAKLPVSGIAGISAVYYEQKDSEWFLETAGSNMGALFNNSRVDFARTYSNNMWEVLETLGIEAARELLIREFQECVSSDGTCVNPCHIQLLVDTMTHGTTVMSISRYGQRKSRTSVLAKASFEESLDNFLKAGLRGETDTTNSVSASIMVGKMPTCGTGIFSLEVDLPKLMMQPVVRETYDAAASYTF